MPAAGYAYASVECIGGVGAEVFGVVGEAESGLFDYSGRKSVEYFGVGN